MQIGSFEVYSIVTGTFRLDGGAMFGVVPKSLWANAVGVDELNRIDLATRTLLVVQRAEKRVILADTGCGSKWSPAHAERYAIRHDAEAIPRALARIGLSTADVTDVVVTHPHFDHNGGLTNWFDDSGGRTVLLYPHARHWIHEVQWKHAWNPNPKDRASYLREDFAGLEEAGVLRFIHGDRPEPLMPGFEWKLSHGHTPYQLHPVVGDADRRIAFVGDVIPTSAHLRAGWVMAYDLFPLTTIDEKQEFARHAIHDGWLIGFPHDPKIAAVALDGAVDRPIVSETPDLGTG